jgi:hypothetical protein
MLAHYIRQIDAHVETHETISVHDILAIAGRDSHLIPIILLAIFNIFLAPIPGNSMLIGTPLTLLSLLYLCKSDPRNYRWRVFTRRVKCVAWRKYLTAAIPYAEKLQRLFRPRFAAAFLIENRVASGVSLTLFSFIVFLPIPFANLPGSLGILAIAFGLMERDGLYFALGYLLVLVHLAVIVAIKYTLFFV